MASAEFPSEVIDQAIHRDPILFHRVPIPHRDRLVLQRLEINSHRIGGSDLVLPSVPPPDRLGHVHLDHPALTQLGGDPVGRLDQLLFFDKGRMAAL